MKKLPEYILWLEKKNLAMKPGDKEYGLADCFQKAIKRVKFGQRKPQLSDFIPCNSKGEPMEKPESDGAEMIFGKVSYSAEWDEYQEALDACIFDGWGIGTLTKFLITDIYKIGRIEKGKLILDSHF